MNLFLARHGKYKTDVAGADAGLSSQGIEEVKFLRTLLDQERVAFDAVFSSPLKRTQETAEILRGSSPLKILPELSPNRDADQVLALLPNQGTLLVVSHLPLLRTLSERLGERVSFEPATLALFDPSGLCKIITPS